MKMVGELDTKITSIEPIYEDSILGGYFKVTFGLDNVFKLNFTSFLKHRFEKDDNLRTYVRDADREEISASSIVEDLYSIGCPMEDWVQDHFTDVRSRVSQFDALIQLYMYLKQFNNDNDARRDDE
jgi:hypothetical protein